MTPYAIIPPEVVGLILEFAVDNDKDYRSLVEKCGIRMKDVFENMLVKFPVNINTPVPGIIVHAELIVNKREDLDIMNRQSSYSTLKIIIRTADINIIKTPSTDELYIVYDTEVYDNKIDVHDVNIVDVYLPDKFNCITICGGSNIEMLFMCTRLLIPPRMAGPIFRWDNKLMGYVPTGEFTIPNTPNDFTSGGFDKVRLDEILLNRIKKSKDAINGSGRCKRAITFNG